MDVVNAFPYKNIPELLINAGKDIDVNNGLSLIPIDSQLDKDGKLKEVRLGIPPIVKELQFDRLVGGVKLVIPLTPKV